jgi:hypothetical protein
MDSAQDLPKGRGFPIRTSADQRSLASPRGFSQRATSFIASRRQGIHRTPLSCSGQKTRPPNNNQTNQRHLKQNRTPPPPTPTAAAVSRRRTDDGRTTDRRTSGAIGHANTSNPDSTVKEQAAAAPAKTRQGAAAAKGFEGRQAGKHRRHRDTHAPARAPAGLEAIGFEPTTPCLQSRCSPN